MKQRDGNILAIVRREALGKTRVARNKRAYTRKTKHKAQRGWV